MRNRSEIRSFFSERLPMEEKFLSRRSKPGETVLIWELRRNGDGLEWRQWLHRGSDRKAGEEVAKDLRPRRDDDGGWDAAAEEVEDWVRDDREEKSGEREEAARRMEEDVVLYMMREIKSRLSDEGDDDYGGKDDWWIIRWKRTWRRNLTTEGERGVWRGNETKTRAGRWVPYKENIFVR